MLLLRGQWAQQSFSRSYGAKRTPAEALQSVIEWLHKRQVLISGAEKPVPQLPAIGEESAELRVALEATVAKGYYDKSRRG